MNTETENVTEDTNDAPEVKATDTQEAKSDESSENIQEASNSSCCGSCS